MNNKRHIGKVLVLLTVMLVWVCSIFASAGELSDDNSLSSLGITTEGAEVSPEFSYDRIEYSVSVPSDTTEITLNPVTSNEHASIVDISGTQVVDGKTTVVITVAAENGNQYAYYLYVTADKAPLGKTPEPETEKAVEKQTEKQTEKETEPETEDPRFVKVDRNSLQEAENTITALKTETGSYREKVGLLTKILYGMIALSVILLFIVINLILKKKDLKEEVMAYRSAGFTPESAEEYANGQDYNGQAYGGYDDQGYYDQGYGDQGYGDEQYYDPYQEQPVQEEPAKKQKKAKKSKKTKDDPNTVPKPEMAKNQPKQMPQYQAPAQPYEYQQPAQTDANGNDIEVTMIDL